MIILGASGFIGSHVARRLTDAKRAPSSNLCDLRDVDNARKAIAGHDVVINCAGTTSGSGGAGKGGVKLVADNVRIALSVFEACADLGVAQLICMSSTTGYPDFPILFEQDYFADSVHPAYSAVGESKRFIERLPAMYGVPTTFLRCSGVYGPGADFHPSTSHVIEATIAKVARGDTPLVVWGDGEDRRDAVHVDDVVNAIELALEAPFGAYNIATGQSMSVNELVETVCDCAGYFTQIKHDLSKPVMIRERNLDISKARDALGWIPRISMLEGIRRTYQWYAADRRKCA